MQQDMQDAKPDIVVIYIGVNDVWRKSLSGTGTDADKFEKFYQAIVDEFKKANVKTIICTPAVIGDKTNVNSPQDGDLNEYSSIIRRIASANKLPLVDLRKAFLNYNLANNRQNAEKRNSYYSLCGLKCKRKFFSGEGNVESTEQQKKVKKSNRLIYAKQAGNTFIFIAFYKLTSSFFRFPGQILCLY